MRNAVSIHQERMEKIKWTNQQHQQAIPVIHQTIQKVVTQYHVPKKIDKECIEMIRGNDMEHQL